MTGEAHKAGLWPPRRGASEVPDEFRLLLLCARTRVEPQQRELIRALDLKDLDWGFILDKARSHALIPLLYRNVSELCADRVPPAVFEQLESAYTTNAERNLVLTSELIKLLRNLESAGISAVPYKGPALAVLAYGDVKLRKFYDLDVIIRPRDIIPAKSLLEAHGYEWRPFRGQATGRKEARNFRFWHEYNFVHPDTQTNVDLHWRISSRRFPFDIDLEALWEGLKPARLLDEDIRVFPPEVLLLFLCVHGSKDLWWRRIGWICDIAELLASSPDLDWSYSYGLATQTGARRMLLLGLALARELLQTPLPEQVSAWIQADNVLQALVKHTRDRLFDQQTSPYEILEKQRFRIIVRERLRDRIPIYRHSAEVILAPNIKDRELVKLPEALSALYYLVRPARLAYKLWSHTIRRGHTTP
jgi:Uncharacterised nucleotidyltransferase